MSVLPGDLQERGNMPDPTSQVSQLSEDKNQTLTNNGFLGGKLLARALCIGPRTTRLVLEVGEVPHYSCTTFLWVRYFELR
jgi:hypothetical protein